MEAGKERGSEEESERRGVITIETVGDLRKEGNREKKKTPIFHLAPFGNPFFWKFKFIN